MDTFSSPILCIPGSCMVVANPTLTSFPAVDTHPSSGFVDLHWPPGPFLRGQHQSSNEREEQSQQPRIYSFEGGGPRFFPPQREERERRQRGGKVSNSCRSFFVCAIISSFPWNWCGWFHLCLSRRLGNLWFIHRNEERAMYLRMRVDDYLTMGVYVYKIDCRLYFRWTAIRAVHCLGLGQVHHVTCVQQKKKKKAQA